MGDKIKLALAMAIVAVAIGGFYVYADQSLLLRVIALLVAVTVAAFIAVQTETGAGALAYSRGSLVEIRKVVWPTRKETVQTTMMVMAMVLLVGIILWVFDMLLAWAVKLLTGQGG